MHVDSSHSINLPNTTAPVLYSRTMVVLLNGLKKVN